MSGAESPPGGVVQDATEEAGFPLSFNQQFLCLFDQGDDAGPFGPHYHLANAWWVDGRVDPDALRAALDDLVARHEALRTTIVRGADRPYQVVRPASSAQLQVRDLSDTSVDARAERVEALLDEVEAEDIDISRLPLVAATLGRFDDESAVLVLLVHHSATDGWSMRVLMRDLAFCYARRRGHQDATLPEAPSYREFAQWQQEAMTEARVGTARAFWRERLAGARIFTVPTDHPRSAALPSVTAAHRFRIGPETMSSVTAMARKVRGSPFMVLFGAFAVVASRVTGSSELTVPTFTPGRGHERFGETVGSFFNFLPIRTDITPCTTFREVVDRVRGDCLDAFSYDIPSLLIFDEAPELMQPATDDRAAPVVFQAFPLPYLLESERIGDVEYTEVYARTRPQSATSEIPDGALWTVNIAPEGDSYGSVQYRTNLYDHASVNRMVDEYTRVLSAAVQFPDMPVAEL